MMLSLIFRIPATERKTGLLGHSLVVNRLGQASVIPSLIIVTQDYLPHERCVPSSFSPFFCPFIVSIYPSLPSSLLEAHIHWWSHWKWYKKGPCLTAPGRVRLGGNMFQSQPSPKKSVMTTAVGVIGRQLQEHQLGTKWPVFCLDLFSHLGVGFLCNKICSLKTERL